MRISDWSSDVCSSDLQKRLKSKSADFADMIAAFARDEMSADRIEIPEPSEVEPLKGSGFGELVDAEEGRRRLSASATKAPLAEWAGPGAGSSALPSQAREGGVRGTGETGRGERG